MRVTGLDLCTVSLVSDSGLILGLSWIDLVIILAAIGIGVGGWRMGILRASVALLAIVAGVLLAGMYHERVFVDLAIAEVPSGAMRAASFIVILSLVSVGGYVIGTFLRGVASLLLLGWADRAAGALFGVLFGLLLAQATIAIVVLAGLDDASGEVGESVIGWVMMDNVPVVRALLPSEFDLAIQQFVADVDALRSTVDGVQGPLGGG
ncbi:MAG: CvpA family protein [Chloroflexi bacterium]|nr:CvpA family protein [Chloroflexota bacterium]